MFKKTGVKLELSTDENMSLTYEEGIRGGICNKVHSYAEDFIESYYDKEGDAGYLLVVDIEYPKALRMLHSDLPFLSDRINKVKKLVCNVTDKENYSIHIVALKQALNHGLKLIRVHSVISFRQEAWLKPYIDLNTELKKILKINLKKTFTS